MPIASWFRSVVLGMRTQQLRNSLLDIIYTTSPLSNWILSFRNCISARARPGEILGSYSRSFFFLYWRSGCISRRGLGNCSANFFFPFFFTFYCPNKPKPAGASLVDDRSWPSDSIDFVYLRHSKCDASPITAIISAPTFLSISLFLRLNY